MASAHQRYFISPSFCGTAQCLLDLKNLVRLYPLGRKHVFQPLTADPGAFFSKIQDAKPVTSSHHVSCLMQLQRLVHTSVHPVDRQAEDVCIHVSDDQLAGATCIATT